MTTHGEALPAYVLVIKWSFLLGVHSGMLLLVLACACVIVVHSARDIHVLGRVDWFLDMHDRDNLVQI
jgi:hypothetical protein